MSLEHFQGTSKEAAVLIFRQSGIQSKTWSQREWTSVFFFWCCLMTKSGLLSRPLDLIYFVYFATHIPITLCIDLQTFCPSSWVPNTLVDLFHFYKITFKDPLMGSSEPMYWYLSFLVCELVIQLPFFFAACYGLFKGISFYFLHKLI